MTEAELQATILSMAGKFGWKRHHEWDSRKAPKDRDGDPYTDKGFPDFIGYHPGYKIRGIAAEFKQEGKEPTGSQERWLWFFGEMGFEIYVWTPKDLDSGEIERILRGNDGH